MKTETMQAEVVQREWEAVYRDADEWCAVVKIRAVHDGFSVRWDHPGPQTRSAGFVKVRDWDQAVAKANQIGAALITFRRAEDAYEEIVREVEK